MEKENGEREWRQIMERETERQRSHAAELCVLALVYVSALILYNKTPNMRKGQRKALIKTAGFENGE
jgi:hypothetical protein